jgi:hypothetical protein
MLKTIFTFSLGTICGILLARRAHRFFHFDGLKSLAAKSDLNKRVLVSNSAVEERRP